MDELKAFFASLEPGTRVKVTNHDYLNGSGMETLEKVTGKEAVLRPDRPASSQGRRLTRSSFRLDVERDYEIHGRVLKVYNPSHAYVGGRRAVTLTMEFLEDGS